MTTKVKYAKSNRNGGLLVYSYFLLFARARILCSPYSHVKQYGIEPLDSADPLQTVTDSAEHPLKNRLYCQTCEAILVDPWLRNAVCINHYTS